MSDPFVAEVRIVGFNFAPRGWAFCNGQILPLSQNTALFSLLGTTYGGNGQSTFALPNLQGMVPMAPGQGPGLSNHDLGETAGTETVTLSISQLPTHTHAVMAANVPGAVKAPGPDLGLDRSSGGNIYLTPPANLVPMAANNPAPNVGDQPHNNMMPYLSLNFVIALQGIFPPRS